MRLARAVDLWMGELARAGREASTRNSYSRHLNKLIDHLERTKPDPTAREVTVNDCRSFLDNWIDRSASTQCTVHSALNGLFAWLYLEGEIDANPMTQDQAPTPAPPRGRRCRDASRAPRWRGCSLATKGWQEFLCLSVLAYIGNAAGLREPAALEGRRPGRGDAPLSRREGRQVLREADAVRPRRDPPGGTSSQDEVSHGPERLRDPEPAHRRLYVAPSVATR